MNPGAPTGRLLLSERLQPCEQFRVISLQDRCTRASEKYQADDCDVVFNGKSWGTQGTGSTGTAVRHMARCFESLNEAPRHLMNRWFVVGCRAVDGTVGAAAVQLLQRVGRAQLKQKAEVAVPYLTSIRSGTAEAPDPAGVRCSSMPTQS